MGDALGADIGLQGIFGAGIHVVITTPTRAATVDCRNPLKSLSVPSLPKKSDTSGYCGVVRFYSGCSFWAGFSTYACGAFARNATAPRPRYRLHTVIG